jgi:hypothetical protein
MKHNLQLVAFCVAAMLALPHAVAAGLCLASHAAHAMDCCADSADSSRTPVSNAAPVALAQFRHENCCSVFPQPAPLPGALEKTTSVPAPQVQIAFELIFPAEPFLQFVHNSRFSAIATDRQILLHVFRI